METSIQPKIQINCSVRTNSKGEIMERTTLLNVRCDEILEAVRLFNQLRTKINGTHPNLLPASGPKAFPDNTEKEEYEHVCPQCGGELIERHGSRGDFLGCRNYPGCKHTEAL